MRKRIRRVVIEDELHNELPETKKICRTVRALLPARSGQLETGPSDSSHSSSSLIRSSSIHKKNNKNGLVSAALQPEKEEEQNEQGDGSSTSPYRLALRHSPNQSGCLFCPSEVCSCPYFSEFLKNCYEAIPLKRIALRYRQPALCAKSVLPMFVSRMIRIGDITKKDLFVDLGCGNGSVVLQVAAVTGARCIGVELDAHNAAVAARAVEHARPILEQRWKHPLDVSIVHGDMCQWLREKNNPLFNSGQTCVVWAANLLMPKPVNHFLSEALREIPTGSRVFCFEDLYPHSRSVAKLRDPDAFSRFIMKDYVWQLSSVEWCDVEGKFFSYTRV